MNRRYFVRVLALAPVAGAVGCSASGSTATINLAQISSDVVDIVAGLKALATAPAIQVALPSAALNILATALAEAKAIAAQVTAPQASFSCRPRKVGCRRWLPMLPPS